MRTKRSIAQPRVCVRCKQRLAFLPPFFGYRCRREALGPRPMPALNGYFFVSGSKRKSFRSLKKHPVYVNPPAFKVTSVTHLSGIHGRLSLATVHPAQQSLVFQEPQVHTHRPRTYCPLNIRFSSPFRDLWRSHCAQYAATLVKPWLHKFGLK